MLEIGIKLIVTAVGIVGILVCIWLIHWAWSKQIDPKATLKKVATKPFEAPAWVATRDPNKVYQNGVAVGDVSGEVQREGTKVVFAQLANTAQLKTGAPVEYQRIRLRIVQVQSISGVKSVVTGEGSSVTTNVMEGVECEVVD